MNWRKFKSEPMRTVVFWIDGPRSEKSRRDAREKKKCIHICKNEVWSAFLCLSQPAPDAACRLIYCRIYFTDFQWIRLQSKLFVVYYIMLWTVVVSRIEVNRMWSVCADKVWSVLAEPWHPHVRRCPRDSGRVGRIGHVHNSNIRLGSG